MLISFWLCLFIIKLYSRNDIFKHIRKKHGKGIYNIIRSFETLKIKYQKVILNLKFIKTCKKEGLFPTFANVRLSVKHGSAKLKKQIRRIIMENKMEVKHQENKKLKQEIKALSTHLKIALPTLVYTTLLNRILQLKVESNRQQNAMKGNCQSLENINKRVISSVVSKSVKMSYTIFGHTHYQLMKLWHLIMYYISTYKIR